MTGKISLTASMRSNLLSLQNISRQVSSTQNKLATGNKVNSAIDNPSSYYIARSLTNRASDLDSLLDSMGQAVSTIKTATTALETGAAFLEQAAAVATSALEHPIQAGAAEGGKSAAELEAEGYQVVNSADELKAALADGAKIALGGDITLDSGLSITASNVSIDGNGHTLKYTAPNAREAAIAVDGGGANVDIKNLNIEASGDRVYGIRVTNGGGLTIDNIMGIKVNGVGAQKVVNGNADIYDGKSNTKAAVNQLGKEALAAWAADNFYVGDKNGAFGQGQWYLPAIGELMDFYGTDVSKMTNVYDTSGAVGDNKAKINAALTTLGGKGADAKALNNDYYWSSSEFYNNVSWGLSLSSGYRVYDDKDDTDVVRPCQLLENCFNPLTLSAAGGSGGAAAPKIGDVMYADKTWGSANDYDGSKQAVGIVSAVGNDGSVKIISLKDLTFSSLDSVGNFNPDDPYGGSRKYTQWTTNGKQTADVVDIPNYNIKALLTAAKSGGTLTINNIPFSAGGTEGGGTEGGGAQTGADASAQERFNNVLNQYDMLIKDASYKGVNLLRSQNLNVRFNENGNSDLSVIGKDASAAGLGLNKAGWQSLDDVAASIKELATAMNKIRNMTSELGNNYSIVSSRQDFTENLINILTEGADKLTLADMNEESANMLALQTRQQLAINSLSLASQAAQSIMKLF